MLSPVHVETIFLMHQTHLNPHAWLHFSGELGFSQREHPAWKLGSGAADELERAIEEGHSGHYGHAGKMPFEIRAVGWHAPVGAGVVSALLEGFKIENFARLDHPSNLPQWREKPNA